MNAKSDERNERVRITMQFRTARGMAYDLRDATTRITVFISEVDEGSSAGAWEVEAKTPSGDGEARAVAPTRSEALHQVVALWSERHLPRFDWKAAEDALIAVRAL